ncbi:MAG: hypothetical protein Q4C70_03870 [Planctomycetia bacterium]|nr:hypothetical protein [Planctomycetia bacterium]
MREILHKAGTEGAEMGVLCSEFEITPFNVLVRPILREIARSQFEEKIAGIEFGGAMPWLVNMERRWAEKGIEFFSGDPKGQTRYFCEEIANLPLVRCMEWIGKQVGKYPRKYVDVGIVTIYEKYIFSLESLFEWQRLDIAYRVNYWQVREEPEEKKKRTDKKEWAEDMLKRVLPQTIWSTYRTPQDAALHSTLEVPVRETPALVEFLTEKEEAVNWDEFFREIVSQYGRPAVAAVLKDNFNWNWRKIWKYTRPNEEIIDNADGKKVETDKARGRKDKETCKKTKEAIDKKIQEYEKIKRQEEECQREQCEMLAELE